jgi:hypothetical protein
LAKYSEASKYFAIADRDDVAGSSDVDPLHCDGRPEHNGLERTPEVLFKRRVKADGLLGLGVGVHNGFLNHGVEPTRSESAAHRP